MSTTATTKTERPGWDKRAWKLAAILCGVNGVLLLAGTLGPDNPGSGGGRDSLLIISFVLAAIVFPPILSGLARRRTLLWAYLPMAVWFFALVVAGAIDGIVGWAGGSSGSGSGSKDDPSDTLIAIFAMLVGPLISGGPVCIIRYALKRANSRRQAQAAAMEQAIQAPREGVWPPPPSDYGVGQ